MMNNLTHLKDVKNYYAILLYSYISYKLNWHNITKNTNNIIW